jgi:hypothetical protein
MNQDSLPSFLKIAERLKIKGLCESLSPAPIPPLSSMMQQRKEMMMGCGGDTPPPPPNVSHGNFENLLPRSPYVQTEPIVSMPQQVGTSLINLINLQCCYGMKSLDLSPVNGGFMDFSIFSIDRAMSFKV